MAVIHQRQHLGTCGKIAPHLGIPVADYPVPGRPEKHVTALLFQCLDIVPALDGCQLLGAYAGRSAAPLRLVGQGFISCLCRHILVTGRVQGILGNGPDGVQVLLPVITLLLNIVGSLHLEIIGIVASLGSHRISTCRLGLRPCLPDGNVQVLRILHQQNLSLFHLVTQLHVHRRYPAGILGRKGNSRIGHSLPGQGNMLCQIPPLQPVHLHLSQLLLLWSASLLFRHPVCHHKNNQQQANYSCCQHFPIPQILYLMSHKLSSPVSFQKLHQQPS